MGAWRRTADWRVRHARRWLARTARKHAGPGVPAARGLSFRAQQERLHGHAERVRSDKPVRSARLFPSGVRHQRGLEHDSELLPTQDYALSAPARSSAAPADGQPARPGQAPRTAWAGQVQAGRSGRRARRLHHPGRRQSRSVDRSGVRPHQRSGLVARHLPDERRPAVRGVLSQAAGRSERSCRNQRSRQRLRPRITARQLRRLSPPAFTPYHIEQHPVFYFQVRG